MPVVSMKDLLEAGVHFGHQTRRWNPKMKRFIFTERGGIYIIDLQQTQQLLDEAHGFARAIAERGGTVLFVGTKKQAQDAVATEAARVGMPYVNHRWLGGLLTNWRTISDRIQRLHELRSLQDRRPARPAAGEGAHPDGRPSSRSSRRTSAASPTCAASPTPSSSSTCARSSSPCARRAGSALPVIALVDTNCDPDEAEYVIPGNDDAIRSCSLIVRAIADGDRGGKAAREPGEMAAPERRGGRPRSRRPRPRPLRARGARGRGSRRGGRQPRRPPPPCSRPPSPSRRRPRTRFRVSGETSRTLRTCCGVRAAERGGES